MTGGGTWHEGLVKLNTSALIVFILSLSFYPFEMDGDQRSAAKITKSKPALPSKGGNEINKK